MSTSYTKAHAGRPDRLALLRQRYYRVACDDMSCVLLRAKKGFLELLNDPRHKEFCINPNIYSKDEFGEPYEIGLLHKKSGQKKSLGNKGFFDKLAGRTKEDPMKQRFHYTGALMEILPEELKNAYREFLDACAEMNDMAKQEIMTLCHALDSYNAVRSMPLYNGSLVERMNKGIVITRLALYLPVKGRAPDAQPHADRDLFTVHPYSSHPGLYFFGEDKRAIAARETATDDQLVFIGDKFQGITRGKHGRSMVHGVRDPRRKAGIIPETEARFTVVSFAQCALSADDVKYMKRNPKKFVIDQSQYRFP